MISIQRQTADCGSPCGDAHKHTVLTQTLTPPTHTHTHTSCLMLADLLNNPGRVWLVEESQRFQCHVELAGGHQVQRVDSVRIQRVIAHSIYPIVAVVVLREPGKSDPTSCGYSVDSRIAFHWENTKHSFTLVCHIQNKILLFL